MTTASFMRFVAENPTIKPDYYVVYNTFNPLFLFVVAGFLLLCWIIFDCKKRVGTLLLILILAASTPTQQHPSFIPELAMTAVLVATNTLLFFIENEFT